MKKLIILAAIVGVTNFVAAQKAFLPQNEVGFNIGVNNMQGDFLQDGALDGKLIVNGVTVNFTHHLHLIPRRYNAGFVFHHFMLKNTIGFTTAKLERFNADVAKAFTPEDFKGVPVRLFPNETARLGSITSDVKIISVSSQVQFYFRDLIAFMHRRSRYRKSVKYNPFVFVGASINYVTPGVTYDIDRFVGVNPDYTPENLLPEKYTQESFSDESEIAFSVNLGGGIRYKLNKKWDIMGEMKVNLFFSDTVDGVNPGAESSGGNDQLEDIDKSLDFNTTITIGGVYHLW